MIFEIDMIQTIAVAVAVLFLGSILKRKFSFFDKFCIPSPVIGGVVFSLVSLIGYITGKFYFEFDIILQDVFMVAFFTSVGYSASLKLLKTGGIKVFVFLALVILLVVLQDLLGIVLARFFGLNELLGLCTASIPMIGGHGTSGAFGPSIEALGVEGATTVALASATFGLVVGSMLGGPIGKRLIEKNDLINKLKENKEIGEIEESVFSIDTEEEIPTDRLPISAYQIIIAMGFGTIISKLLNLTGMTFPIYIGAMFAAAIIRNISDFTGKYKIYKEEIDILGNICLSLFLGMALMTLRLWELAELAIPMIVMLLAQAVLMGTFAYFITFNVMGKDYDAAVIACGNCGFGMGATANAMANMQALTGKYVMSKKAFFIVPLVGSLFVDFFNTAIITFFINLFV